MVHSYRTGRTTFLEFVTSHLVITGVPDSLGKKVEELVNSFGEDSDSYRVLFVKDITGTYQLGTKLVNEEILKAK